MFGIIIAAIICIATGAMFFAGNTLGRARRRHMEAIERCKQNHPAGRGRHDR